MIIGGAKARKEIEELIKKYPIKMGNATIEQALLEKYLEDLIHQLGCARSIQETINERIRKITSTMEEIIKISESPWMGGLSNSFKLFRARIIPALLNNSKSWIGLNDSHIKELQDFHD